MSDFNLTEYRKTLKDTIYFAAFRTVDGESSEKFIKNLNDLINITKEHTSEVPQEEQKILSKLLAVFRIDQFIDLGIGHIYTHFTKVPLSPSDVPVEAVTEVANNSTTPAC